eukprot:3253459-Rhodomonas_salina.1
MCCTRPSVRFSESGETSRPLPEASFSTSPKRLARGGSSIRACVRACKHHSKRASSAGHSTPPPPTEAELKTC